MAGAEGLGGPRSLDQPASALPLAKSLGRNDALLPILWGLLWNVLTQGRVAESLP